MNPLQNSSRPNRREPSTPPRDLANARSGGSLFPPGAILCIDDDELIIYRGPSSDSANLHTVYSLLTDGSIHVEALSLDGRTFKQLGQLGDSEFALIEARRIWNRSVIASGCWKADYAERIPYPEPSRATNGSAAPSRTAEDSNGKAREAAPPQVKSTQTSRTEGMTLTRGQRFTASLAGKSWEAVFIAKDGEDWIVACSMGNRWQLIRADPLHFPNFRVSDAPPDKALVDQILNMCRAPFGTV
jgi:hypothetical protein